MCQIPIPDTPIRTRIGWKVLERKGRHGRLYTPYWGKLINSNIIEQKHPIHPVSAFRNKNGAEELKKWGEMNWWYNNGCVIAKVRMYNSQLSRWDAGRILSKDQANQCLSADLCEILEIIEER